MEEGLVVARDNKIFLFSWFRQKSIKGKGEGGGVTKKITDQRTANMGGGGGQDKLTEPLGGINQIFVLTQLKSSNPSLPPHPGDR